MVTAAFDTAVVDRGIVLDREGGRRRFTGCGSPSEEVASVEKTVYVSKLIYIVD